MWPRHKRNLVLHRRKMLSFRYFDLLHLTAINRSFGVPGWNELVDDKYYASRKACLNWVAAGKPHYSMLNEIMRRTRSQFKLALRYCKQHEMTLRADALANSLSNKEYRKFWKSVNRSNNNKAVKYGSTIDGCSGDNDIHRMTLTSL